VGQVREPRGSQRGPFRTPTLRTLLAALGLSVAVAAVPAVASASIALGTVVSANPANFTPNVASGAVYKFVQVGPTVYPGGTFARSIIAAFNASTGVISSFAPSVSGEVWALASDGTSLWIGGTFTSVGGQTRYRAFMLTLGATASVNAWYYPPLQNLCAAAARARSAARASAARPAAASP
jgi:hypothetical protein